MDERAARRTTVRRTIKYVIGDMIERALDTGVDLSDEAERAGITEAELVAELRRMVGVMFDAWARA